ncbi:GM16900 [Drosophila sechellia]|uniref:GM16900 n=1 Tax=Drosophila sechellia TaxID=7238 RepID=B4IN03_DROSE|nr:GM16900 [Drosophila sechellia]
MRWSGPLVSGVQEPANQFLLDLRENRAKDFGMLPQIGKRHATPASDGQPGFARCSPSKLMGNLKAEERPLSATVLIDGVEIEATGDTGATASFISEELADRLQAAREVLPTRREVRMADGRYEDVTSMIEVDIGLGERTVRMQLLILHNIIDALVLGWDFLTRVGARVECAGLTVTIPVCSTGQGRPKEKLSVAVVERVDFSEEDVDEFLRSELTSLENVQGTSTVAEHRITMKDDQPVK